MLIFNEVDKNKKWVFQVVLWFTAIAGFLFSFLNYHRDLKFLSAIELITALIAIWLLYKLKHANDRREFRMMALVFITFFLVIMMYAFTLKGASISIYTFALTIPLVCYLLLGMRIGFLMTSISYSVVAYIFFGLHSGHEVFTEKIAYANVIVCALLIWGVSHFYEHANSQAKEKLRLMAIKDHLTGLYNRTVIERFFSSQLEEANVTGMDLGILLFDLDRFKSINDDFGHNAGDDVLCQFANLLKECCESGGAAFRLGGEEFAIIVALSPEQKINSLAESILEKTKSIIIPGTVGTGQVSVSIGVDRKDSNEAVLSDMLKQADVNLYRAKDIGRNCFVNLSEEHSVP